MFYFDFDEVIVAFGIDSNSFGDGNSLHNLTATSDTGSFSNYIIDSSPSQRVSGQFWGVIDSDSFTIVTFDVGNDEDRIGLDHAAFSVAASEAPEPATILLFGTGLAGLASGARRKKKSISVI